MYACMQNPPDWSFVLKYRTVELSSVVNPTSIRLLSHGQNVTVDRMVDADRIRRGIEIRRPKKKRNIQNDVRIKSCIERYDNGAYSRLQFLKAISLGLGAHTEAFQVTSKDDSDRDAATSQSSTSLRLPLLPPPSPLSLHPMTCARCALSNLATG